MESTRFGSGIHDQEAVVDDASCTPLTPLELANRNEKERQDLIAHCVKTRDEAIAALKHMGHVDPPPVPEKRSYVRKQKTGVSA